MIKIKYYRYLGNNGTLETPIEIPGVYHTSFYHLQAEDGKILTDGTRQTDAVSVSESELDAWSEVDNSI